MVTRSLSSVGFQANASFERRIHFVTKIIMP